ncbi:MAG: hypothetical protein ACXVKI_17200 [Flavisolibacter sp.]
MKRTVAQSGDCVFKAPFFLMHFGTGNVQDVNTSSLALYDRVFSTCPTDGHYAYTSHTSDCFNGDWHTLTEDHTPGDVGGNMLLVNSAYDKGIFFTTHVKGFKSGKIYQFGVWLMNVCKPSNKCPFPLLPNLIIRLQTPAGRTVAQFVTGDLPRREVPEWTQHRARFTVPPSETELILSMVDDAPGGCGNDFALDDISFSECIKQIPPRMVEPKKVPPVPVKRQPAVTKKMVDKRSLLGRPAPPGNRMTRIPPGDNGLPVNPRKVPNPVPSEVVPVPLILKQRTNPLIQTIETTEGEILVNLYDNGEIDGDTISVYHNNKLIISKQRLSEKPISFRIQVDKNQPHHELVMVAINLGSIPPNTSLMIVTTKEKRYEVFISSTEQQNAKIVIDLKQ